MVAEPLLIEIEQPMPMAVFLDSQLAKLLGLSGVRLLEVVRQVGVHPGVLFFQRDSQRQDFAVGQMFEVRHSAGLSYCFNPSRSGTAMIVPIMLATISSFPLS